MNERSKEVKKIKDEKNKLKVSHFYMLTPSIILALLSPWLILCLYRL